MRITPATLASPREQLTVQYKDRAQRVDIQYTMRTMRYDHPDVTSVTYFERLPESFSRKSPYGGIARIELSSLKDEEDVRPESRKTMLREVQSASVWLVERLRKLGLPPQQEK